MKYGSPGQLVRSTAKRINPIGIVALGCILAPLMLAGSPVLAQRKSCIDCHKEYKSILKMRNVHKPAKDCETCHKRHGFAQKLVLVKPPPELCTDCHEAIKDDLKSASVHPALSKGGCTVCHDPHASNRRALMRQMENGIPPCVVCHEQLAADLAGRRGHEPFMKGDCSACHAPHSSNQSALLVSDENTICDKCHNSAHNRNDIELTGGFRCTDCHDPHTASPENTLASYAHAPFSSGKCESCHDVTGGTVAHEIDFPPENMCSKCHRAESDSLAATDGHFGNSPLSGQGTIACLKCHTPHRGTTKDLLRGTEDKVCRSCHDDLATSVMFSGNMHQPFIDGDCSSCHAPHSSSRRAAMSEQDDVVCGRCHAELVAPALEGQTRHKAMEQATCTGCHTGHGSPFAPLLAEHPVDTCQKCHPNQPYREAHAPYRDATCGACHRNHSREKGLLAAPEKNLCAGCHAREAQAAVTAPNQHPPVRDEACTFCHVPHGGDAAGLLKQPQDQGCSTCHNVETLVVGGTQFATPRLHEPFKKGDCRACHDPHGSSNANLLVRPMDKLCYGCHTQEKVDFAKGAPHRPVSEGKCNACHTPHGGRNGALAIEAQPALCLKCHDMTEPRPMAAHREFDVTKSQCTTCHDPHASTQKHLLNPLVHKPFEDGLCQQCHAETAGGSVAKVPAGTCVRCHPKQEAGTGHQHVEGVECTTCHTPHASKTVALLRAPSSLCTSCHPEVIAAGADSIDSHVHKPIETGSCLDCHKMHDPPAAGYLLSDKRELCASCHSTIVDRRSDKTQHAPFALGQCDGCHDAHAGKQPHLLIKADPELCLSCHVPSDAKMKAAHKTIALSGGACASCHDAHSTPGAETALVRPDLHAPYRSGDCRTCHASDGAVDSTIDVCARCHNSDTRFARGHKGGRRGPDAETLDVCVDCHSPHAGFRKLLRRKREQDTCLQCHDRGEFSRPHVHGAIEKGCSSCHDLHEGNIDLLHGPGLNDVCLGCHKDDAMHTHPVGGEHDDPRTGEPLTCDSCHSPHSSDYEFNLRFDRKRDLCVQCHSRGTMKAH